MIFVLLLSNVDYLIRVVADPLTLGLTKDLGKPN
jgi:hypothetical protein